VCVCSVYATYLKKLLKDLDEILWRAEACGPGKNHLDLCGDLDSFVDPGSFFRILYH